VNTDNRLMSGVSSSSELLAVAVAFDLSWAEIGTLVTNAAESAFAPYEQRTRLVADVIRPAYRALDQSHTIAAC
jgi:adenosine deaminase